MTAILSRRRHLTGVAVERDPQAASLARENLKRYELEARVDVRVMGWQDWPDWAEMDLIVSNPPYIESAEIEGLAEDVRLYDPLQALDGGPDGLEAYRQIIELGQLRMKTGGWLVFEIGYDQDEAVRTLMKNHGFVDIEGARDLGSNDRVVFGRRPGG